jgi:hypothetical protein
VVQNISSLSAVYDVLQNITQLESTSAWVPL